MSGLKSFKSFIFLKIFSFFFFLIQFFMAYWVKIYSLNLFSFLPYKNVTIKRS